MWCLLGVGQEADLHLAAEETVQLACVVFNLGKCGKHHRILAWRTPWAEEPVGYSPWDPKELDMTVAREKTPTGAAARGKP